MRAEGLALNRWMRRSRADRAASERGAVAVEFAIILPVLLMLVFGVISFGIVFAQKAAISSGVRSGARYGAVNLYSSSHTCGNVIAKTRESAVTLGISTGREVGVTVRRGAVTVCSAARGAATPTGGSPPCEISGAPTAGSETLNVTATFPAEIAIPGAINRQFDLTSTGAYLCEYQ